jgi:hypothetical protein
MLGVFQKGINLHLCRRFTRHSAQREGGFTHLSTKREGD